MYDIDKLFVAGGATQYDVIGIPASNRAYIIDISGNTPVVTRQPNMMFGRMSLNIVVLPNGMIVLVGGQTSGVLFSDVNAVFHVEMFNPFNLTWSDFSQTLTTPRTYHSVGILLKDGTLLVGGGGLCSSGCDYASWNHPNVEIITPPYLLDSNGSPVASRPVIVEAPTTFLPDTEINVTMDTSGSHTFALMRLGAATHTVNLDQRRVPLTVVSQVENLFTLMIPTNPVHVPVGMYWLFAMNSGDVPSVGWTTKRG